MNYILSRKAEEDIISIYPKPERPGYQPGRSGSALQV
jgi:hypothetical protein